jgi:ABC-type Fe3+-siderophore transport system permease subunit
MAQYRPAGHLLGNHLSCASTSASAVYLSASQLFPQEVRASAIPLFYATGALLAVSPAAALWRHHGQRLSRLLFIGYAVGAIVMIAAGFIQVIWGVAAERRALESLRELSQAA